MIVGVLLAGGKGSRFKAKNSNKTAAVFNGKPLIQYGINAYKGISNKTYIVIGAYKDSVKAALSHHKGVEFIHQKKRLGTGHAIKVVVEHFKLKKVHPNVVLVGYGDHMTFYTSDILHKVVEDHVLNHNDITFITTVQKNPQGLGRVVRNKQGEVTKIVEEKDASEKEKRITEINAGFYCFSYDFLLKNYKKLSKSPVTGEYYITEFIHMAITSNKKVNGYVIPFKYVGYGINTREDFAQGLTLFNSR